MESRSTYDHKWGRGSFQPHSAVLPGLVTSAPGSSLWVGEGRHVSGSVQFSSVAQSCPTLCDPMNRSTQASLSITNCRSSLQLTPIESVMPYSTSQDK